MSQPTNHDDFVPDPGMVAMNPPRSLWMQGPAGVEFYRQAPPNTCRRVDAGVVCGKLIESGFICEHHVALLVPRMPRAQVLAEANARYRLFGGMGSLL